MRHRFNYAVKSSSFKWEEKHLDIFEQYMNNTQIHISIICLIKLLSIFKIVPSDRLDIKRRKIHKNLFI